jgi:hypothetical protein
MSGWPGCQRAGLSGTPTGVLIVGVYLVGTSMPSVSVLAKMLMRQMACQSKWWCGAEEIEESGVVANLCLEGLSMWGSRIVEVVCVLDIIDVGLAT